MQLAYCGNSKPMLPFLAEQDNAPWSIYASVGVAVSAVIGAMFRGWQATNSEKKTREAKDNERQFRAAAELEKVRGEIERSNAEKLLQRDKEREELRERLTRSEGAIEHLNKELDRERDQNRTLININADLRNQLQRQLEINAELSQKLTKMSARIEELEYKRPAGGGGRRLTHSPDET